jgi:uncharacterized membrane protein YhhN
MIHFIFLSIFFIDFALHIVGEIIENKTLRYITKPLLVPLILLYYTTGIFIEFGLAQILWPLVVALIFGWLGDIFLMLGREGNYFMLGLGSFLIGHIFYIILYLGVIFLFGDILQFPAWGWMLIIPLLLIVGFFYYKIQGKMGDLTVPTIVYLVVIFFMSFFALLLLAIPNPLAFTLVYIGACLFMISDGMIAVDKFDVEIPYSRVYVMLTYATAQYLITQGIFLFQLF